jgi:hypothetical protein
MVRIKVECGEIPAEDGRAGFGHEHVKQDFGRLGHRSSGSHELVAFGIVCSTIAMDKLYLPRHLIDSHTAF